MLQLETHHGVIFSIFLNVYRNSIWSSIMSVASVFKLFCLVSVTLLFYVYVQYILKCCSSILKCAEFLVMLPNTSMWMWIDVCALLCTRMMNIEYWILNGGFLPRFSSLENCTKTEAKLNGMEEGGDYYSGTPYIL